MKRLLGKLNKKTKFDPLGLLNDTPIHKSHDTSSDIVTGGGAIAFGNKQISKKTLIIVAAIFAAFGVYMVLRSFAATDTLNDSAVGTANNQFEFVGNWTAGSDSQAFGGDEHYTKEVGAYYQVRFTGTQVKVYTTEDTVHGKAAVSIDGGPETEIDTYAAARTHGVVVYTSPALSDSSHTLKVRVTGNKNTAATDSYIVADKVEVTTTQTTTPPTTSTPVTAAGCPSGVSPAQFPSRLKTSGRNLVDENGCVMPKLKGFSIHCAPKSGQSFVFPESDFSDIYNNGGRMLRTVVQWDSYEATQGVVNGITSPTGPATAGSAISSLDTHVARAQKYKLYVMLELHLNTGNVPTWAVNGNDETEKYALYGQKITETLSERYGNPASPYYSPAVMGFGLNEPPQDTTTISGNNSIPTFEAQQRTMINWFRTKAPTWIGFVSLAYANQKPQLASPKISADPNAYNTIASGIPGGNVIFDAHDYLVYNDNTDPNVDSRQGNGALADTRYFHPGAHFLGLADPHSYPTDPATADRAKSQMKAYLKPFDLYATAAQMPLMIGEFGWNQTGNSTKGAYYVAKREAMNSVNAAIETNWLYGRKALSQDAWSARDENGNWDQDVLAWLKAGSSAPTSSVTTSTALTLKLINADNDQVIAPLTSGMTIDLATARNLNIDASANTTIESVRFDDNGQIVTESFPPYAIGGDAGTGSTDYYPWTPSVGTHTLTVKAYSADAAGGIELASTTITFTVKDTSPTTTTAPGWEVVYRDDFNTLNTSSTSPTGWSLYNGPGHNGNGLRSPLAFSTSNGELVITAENVDTNGDGVVDKVRSGGMSNRYNMAYGRYEVRMKVEGDSSNNTSGVALTWPQSGVWPGDGELDWFETGTGRNPFKSWIHWPCNEGGCIYKKNPDGSLILDSSGKPILDKYQTGFDHPADAAQYHVVVMEWTPNSIKIFRDGTLVKTWWGEVTNGADAITDPKHIPDVPHHVSLQLDAMDKYDANGNKIQPLLSPGPVRMFVDYVQVSKLSTTSGPDTTSPTISISSPTDNQQVSGTVTANATATDNVGVSNVQFKLDGNLVMTDTTAPYNYSFDTLSLPNGAHTIEAIAYDAAGNVSTLTNNPSSKVTVNVQNLDTLAPNAPTSLTIDPTSQLTAPGTIKLSWPAATDNGSPASGIKGYWVQRNGVTITCQGQTAGQPLTALTCTDANVLAGSYNYTVRSVDNVGLTSTTAIATNPTTLTVNSPPDTTKPSTPTSLTAAAISSSQINLSWSASTDNVGVAGYNVYRGTSPDNITTKLNANLVTTTSFGSTNLTADTTYYYQVEAVDGAGNVSEAKAGPTYTATFAADTLAPTVAIITPTSNATISGNYTVSARATDNVTVSRMELYVDNKLYVTSSSGTLTTNWNTNPKRWEGPHTLVVKAIDNSGNTASTTTSVTVR